MSVDVAVIGGGVIGCSAAAMLAQRGARVAVYEAQAIGAGASGRNLGAIQHPFDAVLEPAYHRSLQLYRELAAEVSSFALREGPAGILLITTDAAHARSLADRLAVEVPGLRPRYLDVAEVAAAEPCLAPGLAACRLETGYPIPPRSATAAWAELAERRGATLHVGRAAAPQVDGGRVVGVRLDDGSLAEAGTVLLAAGPWTPEVLGGELPIRRTWGVTVQVQLGATAPRHVVEEDQVDAVNRPVQAEAAAVAAGAAAEPPSLFTIASAGGLSTLGSTFLPSEPDPSSIAPLLVRRGARYLPALADAEIVEIRVCARPQSADGRPFIGPLPGVQGLHVCAGHGPWGISTGPATAEMAVDGILDGVAPPPGLEVGRAA
jgi:glycine/D-amino acid oxidase-like deaminating enzyme